LIKRKVRGFGSSDVREPPAHLLLVNQTNWTNSGNPITATDTVATTFDAIGSDRQRFYRVVLLPEVMSMYRGS